MILRGKTARGLEIVRALGGNQMGWRKALVVSEAQAPSGSAGVTPNPNFGVAEWDRCTSRRCELESAWMGRVLLKLGLVVWTQVTSFHCWSQRGAVPVLHLVPHRAHPSFPVALFVTVKPSGFNQWRTFTPESQIKDYKAVSMYLICKPHKIICQIYKWLYGPNF